jgi:hypothetical protein
MAPVALQGLLIACLGCRTRVSRPNLALPPDMIVEFARVVDGRQ